MNTKQSGNLAETFRPGGPSIALSFRTNSYLRVSIEQSDDSAHYETEPLYVKVIFFKVVESDAPRDPPSHTAPFRKTRMSFHFSGPPFESVGAMVASEGHGWIGFWRPGIGDPTVLGWLTVVGYLAAAWVCFRAARAMRPLQRSRPTLDSRSAREHVALPWWYPLFLALFAGRARSQRVPADARLRTLWIACAIVMLALGINKQLDLQTALGELGRGMAHAEGWYEIRRPVQLAFILAVLAVGVWGLRALFLLAAGQRGGVNQVLWGAVFLACFVAVRASSFHHVDEMLGWTWSGVRLNAFLELGGIAFVLAGAVSWSRRRAFPVRGAAR